MRIGKRWPRHRQRDEAVASSQEEMMKFLIFLLLAAAAFAAPPPLRSAVHRTPAACGFQAVSQNDDFIAPMPELASARTEEIQAKPASDRADAMGMMMGIIAMLVTMVSTGGTLAASAAFNQIRNGLAQILVRRASLGPFRRAPNEMSANIDITRATAPAA